MAPAYAGGHFTMLPADIAPAADSRTVYDGDDSAGAAALETSAGETVAFEDDATASSASIINNGGATRFSDSSTAASATLTANKGGTVHFGDQSTAADARIVNNEGGQLSFDNAASAGNAIIANNASMRFAGRASADNAEITLNEGGTLAFDENSGGGISRITNNGRVSVSGDASLEGGLVTNNEGGDLLFADRASGGTTSNIANSGTVEFSDDSTLGSTALANNETGAVTFGGNSSAGDGFIANSGTLAFGGNATAADAEIVGNEGGSIVFGEDSTAGNATIASGAGLRFAGRASAGNADITMAPGTTVAFVEAADGGTASLQLDEGSRLDIASADGSVGLGRISGAGDVMLGANVLSIGDDEALVDFAGDIDDAGLGGGLEKRGAGTLNLSGSSTYRGQTTIAEGTLQAGTENAFARRSAFIIGEDGTLDLASFDADIGSLAGAGVVNLDDGTLTAGGNGTNTEFSGTIDGFGGFVKQGAGTLTLSGTSTYSGTTFILGGTLAVEGSIGGSAVMIGETGTLTGTGSVGSTTVEGRLAVGAGETLNVIGDLGFGAGGTFLVGLAGSDAGQVSVSGIATLGGLLVLEDVGAVAPGDYTIIAAASIDGEFDQVRSSLAFLDASTLYAETALTLRLERNGRDFSDIARSPNQSATGAAVETLGTGNPVFDVVLPLTVAEARSAFDALSGEIHAHVLDGVASVEGNVRHAVIGRLVDPRGHPGAWGDIRYAAIRREEDGNAAAADIDAASFIGGIDTAPTPASRIGIYGHYTHSDLDVAARGSRAEIDSAGIGIYGGWSYQRLRLRAGAGISRHEAETRREIGIAGLPGVTNTDYSGMSAGMFGEIGYVLDLPGVEMEPYVGLSHIYAERENFSETGAGAASLSGTDESYSRTDAHFGIRLGQTYLLQNGMTVRPSVAVGYQRRLSGEVPESTHAFAGSGPYTVRAAGTGRDAATVEARVDIGMTEKLDAGFFYRGAWSENDDVQTVGVGLKIAF